MRHLIFALLFMFSLASVGQDRFPEIKTELDKKVKSFLERHANTWRDMNVPLTDGKLLYDLVLSNNYQRAVEIGTSTGHSGIWIAWALSKTNGKLITIEIDKDRYLKARANFRKAGLSDWIDARFGDAHELVPALEGTYDFVFSDADKFWYKNYFIAMDPKLVKGGCFAAHNTSMRMGGIKDFLDYLERNENYSTTIDDSGPSGISISYKLH